MSDYASVTITISSEVVTEWMNPRRAIVKCKDFPAQQVHVDVEFYSDNSLCGYRLANRPGAKLHRYESQAYQEAVEIIQQDIRALLGSPL